MKFRRLIIWITLVFVANLIGQCHAAHPYHVSNAEVKWNPKSGNFEVALCLWPADLETALSREQGKPIDIDKVENLDEMLKSYVTKHFLIRKTDSSPDDSKPDVRWVGHEKNVKQAWMYFEVTGDKSPASWTIENQIFFDLNDDQLNYLQLTVRGSLNTAISMSGDSKHAIDTSSKK